MANVLSIYWWQIWNADPLYELTGSEVLKDAYTSSIVSTFLKQKLSSEIEENILCGIYANISINLLKG